jgi:type II secretory pathway pseudopilin PulG
MDMQILSGSRKNVIISLAIVALILLGALGYTFLTKSGKSTKPASSNSAQSTVPKTDTLASTVDKPAGKVRVETDKNSYKLGDQIRIIITNDTAATIWYIVPDATCNKSFYGQVDRKATNSWLSGVAMWLNCANKDASTKTLGIGTLKAGEKIDESWDLKTWISDVGTDGKLKAAESVTIPGGTYRITFPFIDLEINMNDVDSIDAVRKGSVLPNQAFSNEFAVDDGGLITTALAKAQDASRKVSLNNIAGKLSLYYYDNVDLYPVTNGKLVKLNDKDTPIYKALVPAYLTDDQMKDPLDPDRYFGYKSLDGSDFELTAILENSKDADCSMQNNLCVYRIIASKLFSKENVDTAVSALETGTNH